MLILQLKFLDCNHPSHSVCLSHQESVKQMLLPLPRTAAEPRNVLIRSSVLFSCPQRILIKTCDSNLSGNLQRHTAINCPQLTEMQLEATAFLKHLMKIAFHQIHPIWIENKTFVVMNKIQRAWYRMFFLPAWISNIIIPNTLTWHSHHGAKTEFLDYALWVCLSNTDSGIKMSGICWNELQTLHAMVYDRWRYMMRIQNPDDNRFIYRQNKIHEVKLKLHWRELREVTERRHRDRNGARSCLMEARWAMETGAGVNADATADGSSPGQKTRSSFCFHLLTAH